MDRFLERHARQIVWAIVALLLLVALWIVARQGLLTGDVKTSVLAIEKAIDAFITANEKFLTICLQWSGAAITLATAIFTIRRGLRYAESQLPKRLVDFIGKTIQTVEGQAAKIVDAVRDKSAGEKAGYALFDPVQLNEALVSIGAPTPRAPRSHDEVINEIGNNLLLAKERLAKVEALKANAHLIRGAVSTTMKPLGQSGSPTPNSDDDFEIAINHPSTRVHGLELRGLLRSRQGAFQSALEDFTAMAAAAGEKGCTQARSQRYQAETLMRQAKGTIVTRYREARRCLNAGLKAIDFDRDRTADERLESARNRATYAEVQAILGADAAIVRKALADALVFNSDVDGKPLNVDLKAAIDAHLEALDAPQP